MKNIKLNAIILFLSLFLAEFSYSQDWANLNYYKTENALLKSLTIDVNRVVFMGNSIIESWENLRPEFFAGKPYINRGISGQTTPQMLLRFRADVIDLNPKLVIILAGTNDIAGNSGPSSLKMIADNIKSMAELAKANGIIVIIASVLPVFDYPWRPGIEPSEKIVSLNAIIESYTQLNDIYYIDFHTAMVNERNGLKKEYSEDGVHPNKKGYKVMEVLVKEAIAKVF